MMSRALVVMMFCLGFLSPVVAVAKEYTFGIVPQQSSTRLAQLWTPVLQDLSQRTGLDIRFATAKDIPTFEKRLAAGDYDFAYMNPYHFTVFNEAPGYVAMAHQGNKRIKGIVVVRKDSNIQNLGELDGQMMAFPSPAAFAATILPIANMEKQGMVIEPKYVSSHDSVYMAVSRGLLPAGGGIVRTFNNANPAVRESLRVLWTSEGYTPHAFAAHPEVAVEDRTRLAKALAALKDTENGGRLLADLGFSSIQLADDADWDDVRDLNIRKIETSDNTLAEQDQ